MKRPISTKITGNQVNAQTKLDPTSIFSRIPRSGTLAQMSSWSADKNFFVSGFDKVQCALTYACVKFVFNPAQ